ADIVGGRVCAKLGHYYGGNCCPPIKKSAYPTVIGALAPGVLAADQSAQRTLRHRLTVGAPRLLLVADVVDAGDVSQAVLDRLIASDVRRAQNGNLAIEGLTLPDGNDGLAGGV